MPAGDQIDCCLSCNVRINRGESKKNKKNMFFQTLLAEEWSPRYPDVVGHLRKGVYPHSDGSLTIVGIDESKGFVDLWVHLFLAMEDIHRN